MLNKRLRNRVLSGRFSDRTASYRDRLSKALGIMRDNIDDLADLAKAIKDLRREGLGDARSFVYKGFYINDFSYSYTDNSMSLLLEDSRKYDKGLLWLGRNFGNIYDEKDVIDSISDWDSESQKKLQDSIIVLANSIPAFLDNAEKVLDRIEGKIESSFKRRF